MNILIAAINAKYIHSNPAVLSLYAYCRKYKENLTVLEFSINNTAEYIISEIFRKQPQVVCFSCYIWNIRLVIEIIPVLKKIMPDLSIVLGGPEVSYEYERIFSKGADIIVIGEGEQTFFELVRYFVDKDIELSDINGISYSKNGATFVTNERKALILDDLPFIYDLDVLECIKNKILYYESSRGCPFRCAYCLSSASSGVRALSVERIFSDLDFFITNKVKLVKFVDRTFNFDMDRAVKIWHYLIGKDNGVTRWHFEISGELLNDTAFKILEKARSGLFQFEIGVQSVNEAALKSISRKSNLEMLYENIKRLLALNNIHIHLDLIAGLPEENFSSFRNSFNTVISLCPQKLQLGFLKLLKGSRLRSKQSLFETGIVYNDEPPYEVLYTNALSYQDILILKDIESVFELYYGSGRFVNSIKYAVGLHETYFDFFLDFAGFWREKNYFSELHGKIKQYEILLEYCEINYPEHKAVFMNFLKFDYLISENVKSLPKIFWENTEAYNRFFKNYSNLSKFLPHMKNMSAGKIRGACNIATFDFNILFPVSTKEKPEMEKCIILFDYSEKTTKLSNITEALYND